MNTNTIVHVRRSIPGVADTFAFQREFPSRRMAEDYLAYNDNYNNLPTPRAGLYGVIVN